MPTSTEPVYVASTAYTGLRFYTEAEVAEGLLDSAQFVVEPGRVDPDIRTEGRTWLAGATL